MSDKFVYFNNTEERIHEFTIRYVVNPTLSLGNKNHAISVFWSCIFESNYEKELVLNRESLKIICDPSIGEEQAAKFETLFTAVRYIRSAAH